MVNCSKFWSVLALSTVEATHPSLLSHVAGSCALVPGAPGTSLGEPGWAKKDSVLQIHLGSLIATFDYVGTDEEIGTCCCAVTPHPHCCKPFPLQQKQLLGDLKQKLTELEGETILP